jgi:tetratricopeptide (TPR) repeat protein
MMSHSDNSLRYEIREQCRQLRGALNRRDLFDDLYAQGKVSIVLFNDEGGNTINWNFLRQMIIGKELARRFEYGDSWSSTDFTQRVAASLIIADQWVKNVQVRLTNKARPEVKSIYQAMAANNRREKSNPVSEQWKAKGNRALASNDPEAAVSWYTACVSQFPLNAVYLTDRAAAYVMLRAFAAAETDAIAATTADPTYANAWSRLGAAKFELGQYRESIGAYEWAIQLGEGSGSLSMMDSLAKSQDQLAKLKGKPMAELSVSEQAEVNPQIGEEPPPGSIGFTSLVHEEQIEGLLAFAKALNWPHLEELQFHLDGLYTRLRNGAPVSPYTWDWLFGLSLPGRFLAHKVGLALVDCTPSLKDMGSTLYFDASMSLHNVSYWRVRTVLGRVLGSLPGVKSVCGWIGPCPAVKGPLNKYIKLHTTRVKLEPDRQRKESNSMQPRAKESIENWAADICEQSNWVSVTCPAKDPLQYKLKSISLVPLSSTEEATMSKSPRDPALFCHAALEFQVGKAIITYNLDTNPPFVSLPSCYNKTDDQHLVHGRELSEYSCRIWTILDLKNSRPGDYEGQGIIVINATGDGAETAARAWCAERGKSAGIRHLGRPCFVCARNAVLGLNLDAVIWVGSVPKVQKRSRCTKCENLENGPMLKATWDDILVSAERGCPSCEVLRQGISLCNVSNHTSRMPALPKASLSSHYLDQRRGYSILFGATPDPHFARSDKVINGAIGRGCGLCLTYIFRRGSFDLHGTAAEIDIFVKKGGP